MKRLSLALFFLVISNVALAKVFEVKDIRIEGLQRVSAGSVFTAFPVNVGDLLDDEAIRGATRALFRTGFFSDITLAEDKGVLIIKLQELPSVATITIEGNKAIKTEDLLNALRDNGLAEGQIFKKSVLEGMTSELQRQYVAQGRYGSSVETKVQDLPRNRISVEMIVDEGSIASISHINIVGNKDFTEHELTDAFELKTTGWLSWVYKDDQYAKEKLTGDLERLESFYKDRGYLKFNIDSTQVSVNPDRDSVYITVNMTEGGIYTVSEIELAGELVVPEEEIRRYIAVQEERTFNQALMVYSQESITQRLGNDGYAFAEVEGNPFINEEDKTAKVVFFINPGKRVYVRRLEFRGNTKTADDVLRREMRQLEGAVASDQLIELGKIRLERTSFVKPDVKISTPEVPGTSDQIDVIYSIEEQSSGSIGASLGFSQTAGLVLGANLQENNFLGTGKQVGIGVNKSEYQSSINLSYMDPYFTVDGVSAGFSVFARDSDYAELDLTAYETESLGATTNFSYPLSEIQRINYGFGYENLEIQVSNVLTNYVSPEILEFIAENGAENDIFTFNLGWQRSTLNRGVFATRGSSQRINFEVAPPGIDELAFYKINYSAQKFFPVPFFDRLTLRLRTDMGFGDGLGDTTRLPFYKNFYAGGFNSVRGYESKSLGPRTVSVGRGAGQTPGIEDTDPIGGNAVATASAELIFPLPFLEDQRNIQASVFFDAGNVFDTHCTDDHYLITNPITDEPFIDPDTGLPYENGLLILGEENCTKPDLGDLRYSFGIGATWLSGFGPITVSFSKPVNSGDYDEEESFQFSLGNTF